MLGRAVDVILARGDEREVEFVKIEVTIRLLARKNGRADVKSSNKKSIDEDYCVGDGG